MTTLITRRFCLSALPLLACLLVPGLVQNAAAQFTMTPNYSTYTSVSMDGTYIYTSVNVSGSSSGTCPTQPAYLANECHSTTHKPQVYNVIGSVGGWQYGSPVYWTSWLSFSNNQQIAYTKGVEYTFNNTGQVICTAIGGPIYNVSALPEFFRVVETTVKLVQDWGNGDCETQAACLPGQTPICTVVVVSDGNPCFKGWDCDVLAYRWSKTANYSCFPYNECLPTTTIPGWCDHY